MTFRLSARSVLLALGLVTSLMPHSASAQVSNDPILKPLWENGATATTVLDSFPGTRPGRYQMIAFPMTLAPNTVGGVFNELGTYDRAVWRLGHWVPTRSGTDKYIEPGTLATLDPGLGYWLITRDSVKVRYDGTAPSLADTFELRLEQASLGAAEWNQLGNPFPFNTAVTNWSVAKRDSQLTLGVAASRNWIDANMRTWNPSTAQYTASGTIPRYSGFWSRLVDRDTSLQWTRWVAQDSNGTGYWMSLQLDSKGNPHIGIFNYTGSPGGGLRYTTRVGNSWRTRYVDVSTGGFPGVFSNIDVDSLDLPYIAHQVWSPGQRPFFTRQLAGGAWSTPEQIDPLGGTPSNGWGIQLRIFRGTPRVVYADHTGGTMLKYAQKGVAGWTVEPISALGNAANEFDCDIGFANSSTGIPHVAAQTAGFPRGLRYFTKVGTTWITEVIDTLPAGETGFSPSLVLDRNNVPHVAYRDDQNGDLKYARKSGSSWVIETVDATGNTGNYPEILIEGNGQPAIAFLEFASMGVPNRIRYAQRSSGGSWQIETVDDVNVSSNLAYMGAKLSARGEPRVVYQGQGSFTQVRYAEKIRGEWRIKIPPVVAPEPPVASEAKPEGAEWAVGVTARQDGRSAETMFLGVANSDAISALRSSKAPTPPSGGMLSLSVPRGTEEYVRDFQTAAGTVNWTFATGGGVAPGEQALDFAGFDLPTNLRLFLSDPDNGWTREVRAGESVTLAARPRTLELVATTGAGPAVTASRDGLSFAYPNPFAANTGLAFTLARRADIRVDLYDVTGRRVRTMERAGAAAGEHVLTWDGRDDGGRVLRSGVYLAAWRAGDSHGSRRLVKVE